LLQLLTNARVFAPELLGTRHLLVGGGRILCVDDDLNRLPAAGHNVEQIDVAGMRLVPGLIDGHAHVTGGGGEAGFSTRVPAVPLSQFSSAGVTAVVGLLGTDDTTRDTRSLLAQTYALREEGMAAWCYTGGYHVPPVTLTGSVRGDIVFLSPVIGVGELAISDHRSSQPTLDELLRVASDAHVAGMIANKAGIVHLHLGDGERGMAMIRDALDACELPARVFNPTHVNRRKALFDEALELAERGCNIDVSAFPVSEDDDGWSAAAALARYFETNLDPDRITVSSDGGGCLPVFDDHGHMESMGIGRSSALIETVVELLDRGFSLENVLPPFTSNVADLLRLSDRGRIQANAVADLVILDDNNNVHDVMMAGRWHMREGRQRVFGQFEQK